MTAPPQSPSQGRAAGSTVARVTQAAICFRQGLAVVIQGGEANVLAFAVETLSPEALADVNGGAMLLTHARARTLKIRLYTRDVVAIPLGDTVTPARLLAIADPTYDLAEPMKGPFFPTRKPLPDAFAASVKLAKLAGLLPATVVKRISAIPPHLFALPANDIYSYEEESVRTLSLITRARVPLEGSEKTELIAFRARDGGPEHYAVVVNAPPPHAPALTRLHSECFTGDLLGSLRCDCGPQLRGAIEAIARAGGGIVLYLAQEGRGIGLVNKLRAYRLQDQGFDTHEANERLGFEPDERLYRMAAKMLALLGYSSVRLLTNNPAKVNALEHAGIHVTERVPHRLGESVHNRAYLQSKAKAGHLL